MREETMMDENSQLNAAVQTLVASGWLWNGMRWKPPSPTIVDTAPSGDKMDVVISLLREIRDAVCHPVYVLDENGLKQMLDGNSLKQARPVNVEDQRL